MALPQRKDCWHLDCQMKIYISKIFPYKLAHSPIELSSASIDVPLSLRSLACSRMESLDDAREILLLIVVIGQEIDLDTLVGYRTTFTLYFKSTEGIILDSLEKLKSYGYITSHQVGLDSIIEFSRRKIGRDYSRRNPSQ